MPEIKSLSYPITVTYAEMEPSPADMSQMVEVEKTVEAQLLHLKRTNKNHCALAFRNMRGEHLEDIAIDFVKYTLTGVDEKVKTAILKDWIACMNVVTKEEVMEDLNSFLSHVDLLSRAIQSVQADNLQ